MLPVKLSIKDAAILVAILGSLMAGATGALWLKIKLNTIESQRETITSHEETISRLNAELAFAEVTRKVDVQYVDRVKVIREKAQTIIKEVPVYVTQEADDNCRLPVGFVRLHDAAAAATDPGEPAGDADARAADVALSEATRVIVHNYGICHELREQVNGLQDWIRKATTDDPVGR